MALSLEEVRKLAELARLELTPEEQGRHAETISAVLEYMKILNEADTDGVEPTFQVTGLADVTREDRIQDCDHRDALVECMPKVEHEELVVPQVFE